MWITLVDTSKILYIYTVHVACMYIVYPPHTFTEAIIRSCYMCSHKPELKMETTSRRKHLRKHLQNEQEFQFNLLQHIFVLPSFQAKSLFQVAIRVSYSYFLRAFVADTTVH